MNYTIYKSEADFYLVKGIKYKKSSVKFLEKGNEYFIILKYFIFKKFPIYTRKLRFNSFDRAECKYENLKTTLLQWEDRLR